MAESEASIRGFGRSVYGCWGCVAAHLGQRMRHIHRVRRLGVLTCDTPSWTLCRSSCMSRITSLTSCFSVKVLAIVPSVLSLMIVYHYDHPQTNRSSPTARHPAPQPPKPLHSIEPTVHRRRDNRTERTNNRYRETRPHESPSSRSALRTQPSEPTMTSNQATAIGIAYALTAAANLYLTAAILFSLLLPHRSFDTLLVAGVLLICPPSAVYCLRQATRLSRQQDPHK